MVLSAIIGRIGAYCGHLQLCLHRNCVRIILQRFAAAVFRRAVATAEAASYAMALYPEASTPSCGLSGVRRTS